LDGALPTMLAHDDERGAWEEEAVAPPVACCAGDEAPLALPPACALGLTPLCLSAPARRSTEPPLSLSGPPFANRSSGAVSTSPFQPPCREADVLLAPVKQGAADQGVGIDMKAGTADAAIVA